MTLSFPGFISAAILGENKRSTEQKLRCSKTTVCTSACSVSQRGMQREPGTAGSRDNMGHEGANAFWFPLMSSSTFFYQCTFIMSLDQKGIILRYYLTLHRHTTQLMWQLWVVCSSYFILSNVNNYSTIQITFRIPGREKILVSIQQHGAFLVGSFTTCSYLGTHGSKWGLALWQTDVLPL